VTQTVSTHPASGAQALHAFAARYCAAYTQCTGHYPMVDYDPHWRSDCESGEPDENNRVIWQPAPQPASSTLSGCEHALETTFHPDIHHFFTTLWLPALGARCEHGDLELIGIWNPDDLDNLQANIIGHALQQQRRTLPFTVFIALTLPESERYLAIDNASGAVVLEEAGQRAEREIAPNLSEFLHALEPRFAP